MILTADVISVLQGGRAFVRIILPTSGCLPVHEIWTVLITRAESEGFLQWHDFLTGTVHTVYHTSCFTPASFRN